MDFLVLFINFIDKILSFEIFKIDLFTYLITIAIFTIIFNIINAFKKK
jgi:hypothetical protein